MDYPYGVDAYGRPVVFNQQPTQSFQTQPQSTQTQAQAFQNQQQNLTSGQPTRYVIPGKPITSEKEITVQDVPNDGSLGVFPFTDGSGIITKAWNNKGSIDTKLYVELKPSQQEESTQSTAVDFGPIFERLDRIEKKLNRGNRPYKKNGGNRNEHDAVRTEHD